MDIEPAKIKVLRHIRKEYACPCCEPYITVAKKSALPFEKSIVSLSLLAYVSVSKYLDALPLYRQVNLLTA
ncbi:IS66 family transposase zinc-finger binding domain-containing protein [Gilvimarinus agarilyticus]|uniref:IS66 family transposase zinc-finger binding domain-containing protein n=1 Tax=Gilvimarinus sp. 2_MG-2023 TaxID=3062666 RepID=UPI001C08B236|nr:IS66 family transposase zinc-finger binding domain-containing protein [Gilvimarinus sp. 2_MG-2023]MBU2887695.1 IS66 family transposase zinc-finger binding domain-containing protein [Gilvimarinus agarilyticus]MDO6572343.1 IS66 family transposase zinc-finger binding domain-containing protein [Gilvimarinus sp. 2_MG-2023]